MSASRDDRHAPRRVLVTGAAGFLGSHLCERCLDAGAEVVGVDSFEPDHDPAHKRAWLRTAQAHPRLRFVEADLRDRATITALLGAGCFDAIAHLAGRGGVRASVEDPARTFALNVDATLALLEAWRARPGAALVFASSSSVHGERASHVPRAGSDVPRSPYAASKQACEALLHSWHHLHGLPVTVLRYFTAYGPRQRPDMAIARFLRRLADGRPLDLYGPGDTARDYTYVDDLAEGTWRALHRRSGHRVYDLGAGRPVTLDALVQALAAATGRTPRVRRLSARPGDVPRTCADPEPARRELGWSARVSLDEGLRRTVAATRACAPAEAEAS